jgi:SagB-type dehydrogenase family enzyme
MSDPRLAQSREFLKDTIRQEVGFWQTAQSRGAAPPPLEKPFSPDAVRIPLSALDQWGDVGHADLLAAMAHRQSRREFAERPLELTELAFLLWATQGVRRRVNRATALRTVPSAGARHALETYLAVFDVQGLEPAIYRYLPLEHELLVEFHDPDAPRRLAEAALGQFFVATAAVVFIWTAVPYRMEWRYGLASHKEIALDAGHVCQNLYLGCEAIGAATCAVAAYHQQLMDQFVRVDGEEEFVIYLAPVGKRVEKD